MRGEHIVDFLGVDVLPAPDNHVLHSVHDIDVAILILDPHIPGMEKSVLINGFGGLLGLVVIALHDVVSADHDFAGFMGRLFIAVLIHDKHFLVGKRQTDGAHFALPVHGVDGTDTGAFGEAVAFQDFDTKGFLEFLHDLFGHRRRAADTEFHRGEIILLSAGIG